MTKLGEFLGQLQGIIQNFSESAEERAVSFPDMYGLVSTEMWDSEIPGWLSDLYQDEDGSLFAVTINNGRLYRTPFSMEGSTVILADTEEVVLDFKPTDRSFQIIRQADGDVRWISRSCVSVINKDGEIDSRKLFDSFVEYAERTNKYPYRTFFHKGEQFRTGQCDFLTRDGYVLITSGIYDDHELAKAEIHSRETEPEYWGDSIGFYATSDPVMLRVADGIEIPVYEEGFMDEISTIPDEYSSSFFTNNSEIVKEVTRTMDAKRFESFVKLFGGDEEKARKWLDDNVDPLNREIEEDGLVARAVADGKLPEDDASVNREDEDTDAENVAEGEDGTSEEPTSEDETEPTAEDETESTAEADPEGEAVYEVDDELVDLIAQKVLDKASPGLQETLDKFGEELKSVGEQLTEIHAASIRAIKDLGDRMITLERSNEEALEDLLNDLPRNTTRRVEYRPRNEKAAEDEEVTFTDIAEETLAGIK